MNKAFALGVFALAAVMAPAQAQLIGGGGTPSGNFFPFGSVPGSNPGTIYQQIYDASSWTEAVTISGISFFQFDGTNLRSGTYTLYLSTSARTVGSVNPLSTSDYDSNRGPDNALFGTFVLGGAMLDGTLTFTGTPFTYDPALGNLLLDLRISDAGPNPTDPARFQLRNAVPFFSRAHNFSSALPYNESFGLITEFNSVPVPEPSTWLLFGLGVAGLACWRGARLRTGAT